MWASDGTPVAFQYHFIRIFSVFRYLSHRILVLIRCYILAPGLAAAQLRASFAVVQFSRQMFLSCCALSYGVLSMLQVGIGPPPSSPDQVRAGSNLWLEGKRLGKGPQDGVGPACMQASAEGQLRSTGGCQGGDLSVGTADRLLAADSPNSHPWQWRNNGSRQVVTQGLSRDGRSAKAA